MAGKSRMTKQINAQYIPTYFDTGYGYGMPQYGFGSFLGSIAGAGLGSLVGMPMLGAQVGGGIGGQIDAGKAARQQQQLLEEQQKQVTQQGLAQQRIAGLDPSLTQYQTPMQQPPQYQFANGGQLPQWLYEARGRAMQGEELEEYAKGGKWIKGAIKKPGALTAAAKSAGQSISEYCASPPSPTASRRCNLRKTLMGFKKEDGGMLEEYAKGGQLTGGLTGKQAFPKGKGETKRYPMVKESDFARPGSRKYPIPTKADAADALRLARMHGATDVVQKVYAKYPDLRPEGKACGGRMHQYANGGMMDQGTIPSYAFGSLLADMPVGSSHEFNPYGGVNIGNQGLIEQDEMIFNSPTGGKYVFSNRLPYTR